MWDYPYLSLDVRADTSFLVRGSGIKLAVLKIADIRSDLVFVGMLRWLWCRPLNCWVLHRRADILDKAYWPLLARSLLLEIPLFVVMRIVDSRSEHCNNSVVEWTWWDLVRTFWACQLTESASAQRVAMRLKIDSTFSQERRDQLYVRWSESTNA